MARIKEEGQGVWDKNEGTRRRDMRKSRQRIEQSDGHTEVRQVSRVKVELPAESACPTLAELCSRLRLGPGQRGAHRSPRLPSLM